MIACCPGASIHGWRVCMSSWRATSPINFWRGAIWACWAGFMNFLVGWMMRWHVTNVSSNQRAKMVIANMRGLPLLIWEIYIKTTVARPRKLLIITNKLSRFLRQQIIWMINHLRSETSAVVGFMSAPQNSQFNFFNARVQYIPNFSEH